MRLFVAIDINDDALKAVAKLQQELKQRLRDKKGIKWVEPENMHLTLKFLGYADDNKLDEIYSALDLACSDKKVFEIIFSIVGTFGRPAKVLWLGSSAFGETSPLGGEKQSEEIVALAAGLEDAFETIGFEKETRPFSAHLTLARIKDNIDRDLQKVLKDYLKVSIPKVSADSVCLYKSQLTEIGPIYTLLRKIELKKDF
ncbi:MAG: RNA 2',3'-cyclic phosphodiesterase [Sedimentisphaerales bacterium]